jgi:hypothetical protein
MPNWRRVAIVLVLLPTAVSLSPVTAQDGDESCPLLVETALEAVGDACENLSRNEACYGHRLVTATAWEQAPLEGFESPGDLANVFDLASLATFSMDVEEETWGIALLRLQADLPDTLPGQGVTFVLYGDAELRSEVMPDVLTVPTPTPLPTCIGITSGGTNLRTGPSTNHALAGSVGAGEAFTVSGRNAAGDWLRVTYRDQFAWVYAPLLTLDCDVGILPEVAGDAALELAYTAPLQAFYLVTGLGEPACEEAPRDGLLVQAPRETRVHFLINGIEVVVGSTALLQIDDDTLGVNTFAGTVNVTSAGRTQTAAPGQRVDAITGEAPAPPVPYDPEDVANAPVDLLPEPVQIPPPASPVQIPPPASVEISNMYQINFCATLYNGLPSDAPIRAGQTIGVHFGWGRWPTLEEAQVAGAGHSATITVDGISLPIVHGDFMWVEGWGAAPGYTRPADATWIATPGTHTLVGSWTSGYTNTCTMTVE